MILTIYESQTVGLLNDEPDWNDSVRIELTVPTLIKRGLTGRETRRPLGDSLRLRVDWSATLEIAELNALRDALQELAAAPVLCPVWPLKLRGNAWGASAYSAQLLVGWNEGWNDYEISATLTPGDWHWVEPLLWGALEELPQPGLPAPTVGQVEFQFLEDRAADFALLPAAVTFAAGPALGDATRPQVFPFEVDWRSAPKYGGAEVTVGRLQLGPGRTRAQIYYPQSAERPQEAALLLASYEEIAALFRWLQDQRFSVGAHYVTTAAFVGRLAATASAGAGSLTLADATQLGANRYLALTNGTDTEIVRVTGVAGNLCTLSANLERAWTAGTTMVHLAMLARHAMDSVRLDFKTPTIATARLLWREVPAEYTVAAAETRGSTIGALATRAWLYQITLDWDGTTQIHYATSFEQDLDYGGHTYTSRPIEHGELRQTVSMDRDEITLKTRWYDGSPFEKFLPNQLDCRVLLALYEVTVTGLTVSNVVQWFGGEITGMQEAEGPIVSFRAAGANALFDRPLLKFLMQPGCNDELFGSWCGLARADWEFTASVYALSGKTVTLETFSRTGGLPSGFGFAHYFALGYIGRTVAGLPLRHFIFDSAAISSSRILITLGSAPSPVFVVGESVLVYPGCDGRKETCQTYHATNNPTGKFNNYTKFAGLPFMPDKNPSLEPVRKKKT